MASVPPAREADVKGADTVTANDEYALSSDSNLDDKAAQVQVYSLEGNDNQEDGDTPPYSEDEDSERSEVSQYTFAIPFGQGEKILEEFEKEEYDFAPRQEPRTDHDLPESRCSLVPIGPIQIRLARMKTELYDEAYDTIVITCIREGETIGCLKAFIARRNTPSPVFSNHLQSIFEENNRLQPSLLVDAEEKGSGIWGAELDTGDCMFIDNIGVLDWWEGLGIGKKMANIALEKAQKLGISWVFTFPHSWDHRERRARRGRLDLAVGYWRSLGFRRVGVLTDFCYSVDPAHPSRSMAPEDDFDPFET